MDVANADVTVISTAATVKTKKVALLAKMVNFAARVKCVTLTHHGSAMVLLTVPAALMNCLSYVKVDHRLKRIWSAVE